MPNYQVITKDIHGKKYWSHNSNFSFAAKDGLCPIVLQEAPRTSKHMPIAFSKTADGFSLFAVQSLKSDNNYLVSDTGGWLGGYIPAVYRAYPFALINGEEGQQALCIDEDSGLLNDTHGQEFFDEKGQPSKSAEEILKFLSNVVSDQKRTNALCALLEELELLEPWPITVRQGDKELPVKGLYRASEKKLNTLDGDTLKKLRDESALSLIYCQLLSMQNIQPLTQLVKPDNNASNLPQELFDEDDGSINFDHI